MFLANEVACQLGNEYISAEHLLAGLLDDEDCDAAKVLKSLGIDTAKMRLDLQQTMPRGPSVPAKGKLPLAPRLKKVFEYAIAEAKPLEKGGRPGNPIDLLIGLLVDNECTAAMILLKPGLTADSIRAEAKKVTAAN
jgi:ATP-dependent Clp protease ATP-binding subunit ClpC